MLNRGPIFGRPLEQIGLQMNGPKYAAYLRNTDGSPAIHPCSADTRHISAHSSVARSVLAVAQKWVPDSTLAAANASKCPPTATSSALRTKKRTVLADR